MEVKKVTKNDIFNDSNSSLKTQIKNKVKKPSLYKVLILNDDYTPMEFVIYLLKSLLTPDCRS